MEFADDTTVEGLVENGDESAYLREVVELVERCENKNLQHNTSKTKEMIVGFRKKKTAADPLTIKGAVIGKILGTTISNTLGRDANVEVTVKKTQQRLFFLRQLKKFGLRRESLIQFYNSVVESVLTFSLCVWYGNTIQLQRDRPVSYTHLRAHET